MKYLSQNEGTTNYTVAITDLQQYRELSGENLVKALCDGVKITGVGANIAQSQLEDQINAFNDPKGLPEIVAIIEGLSKLSEQKFGYHTLPTFSIQIPQEMQAAADQELTVRKAAKQKRIEKQNSKLQLEEVESIKNMKQQNLEKQKSYFNGDNRVQVNYYAKAYNVCVKNDSLNAISFTQAFNQRFFDTELAEDKIEKITGEQGQQLFNAFHQMFNSQNIDTARNQKYQALIQDQDVLNAGNIHFFYADTKARVVAVCSFAQRQVAVQQNQAVQQSEKHGNGNVNPVFQPQVVVQNVQAPAAINNLDDLFLAFNNKKSDFKNRVQLLMQGSEENKTQATDKLEAILTHFADRNQNKQLSTEQIDMLKNSSTFIDWLCSILPGFIQKIDFIGDRAKRYEISNFNTENLAGQQL